MGTGGGSLNPCLALEPGILSLRLHDRSVLIEVGVRTDPDVPSSLQIAPELNDWNR